MDKYHFARFKTIYLDRLMGFVFIDLCEKHRKIAIALVDTSLRLSEHKIATGVEYKGRPYCGSAHRSSRAISYAGAFTQCHHSLKEDFAAITQSQVELEQTRVILRSYFAKALNLCGSDRDTAFLFRDIFPEALSELGALDTGPSHLTPEAKAKFIAKHKKENALLRETILLNIITLG